MTWSLRLSNGDLGLGQSSYTTVTGSAKLVQDLRCYLLERMGTDDLHPEFGSLLDGGLRNGQYVEGVVGLQNDDLALFAIEGDIRRIVRDYQARQLVRAKNDLARYGKATLTRDEILMSLSSIDATRQGDSLYITLRLTTASNTDAILSLGLSN